jgi:hypothetical protein
MQIVVFLTALRPLHYETPQRRAARMHPFITAELVRGRRAELQAEAVSRRLRRPIRHAANATIVRRRRRLARISLVPAHHGASSCGR